MWSDRGSCRCRHRNGWRGTRCAFVMRSWHFGVSDTSQTRRVACDASNDARRARRAHPCVIFAAFPLPFCKSRRYKCERGRSEERAKDAVVPYSKQVDVLEPIDMAEHLDKIELYLGQVCAIAGISKMQLDYWTNKAQIPTKGKKQRIYDMDAVETVMLIKQAKDKGLNLGAAIDAARRFRELKSGAS